MQLFVALVFATFSGVFTYFFVCSDKVLPALVWAVPAAFMGFCFGFVLVPIMDSIKDNTPECLASHTVEQTIIVPMFTGVDSNNQPIYMYVPQVQQTVVCDREGLTPKQKRERR